MLAFIVAGRIVTPSSGVNSTATIHDTSSDDRDHHEQREGVFAGVAAVEADRDEAGDGDQRAGQHRKGGRGVDVGRGLLQGIADLQPRHHHLDGDHGVVDQQAERDDQRAERDALQRDAGILHDDEGDGQHQRDRDRHDQPGAHAEAEEADRRAR